MGQQMTKPAYVRLQVTEAGGRSELEKASVHLVIQYGDNYEKEVEFEIELRGLPEDPKDYSEQSVALRELVTALEAWQAEGGHIQTSPRSD